MTKRFASPVRVTDNGACKKDSSGTVFGGNYCKDFCESLVVEGDEKVACVKEGVPLSGKRGSSRPTMVILPSSDNFQVLLGYEKSKGMGLEGEKGANRTDWGKNAFFHSFPFNTPDTVAPGTQLNLPELDESGDPITAEDGALLYHNARRVRVVAQPTSNMGEEGFAAYLMWREGREGHGQPAHVMGRRLLGGHLPGNLECTESREVSTDQGPKSVCIKGVEDLNEKQLPAEEGDLTDARAHRGFLRGDFLAVLYTFTTNWGRGEGKPYDVYLRRSFNGGKKWTNFSTGNEEAPKNLSNLRTGEEDGNGGWSAMEPRLVPTPGTIKDPVTKAVLTASDVQNDMVFYVSYCTTHNPHSGGERFLQEDEDGDGGMPTGTDVPKDILVTWTDNYGQTFKEVYNYKAGKWQYPYIAKTSGQPDTGPEPNESFGAPQLKITPAGDRMYASYQGNVKKDPFLPARRSLEESNGPCNGHSGQGSDVCTNSTQFDPFFDYDIDGKDGVTTNDLWMWKRCCGGNNRNCRGVGGICDFDGVSFRTCFRSGVFLFILGWFYGGLIL